MKIHMDGFIERVQSTARLFTPQQERASATFVAWIVSIPSSGSLHGNGVRLETISAHSRFNSCRNGGSVFYESDEAIEPLSE